MTVSSTEQIAGDELVDWRNAGTYSDETVEALVATGYLRTAFDRTDPDITKLVQGTPRRFVRLDGKGIDKPDGLTLAVRVATAIATIRFRSVTITASSRCSRRPTTRWIGSSRSSATCPTLPSPSGKRSIATTLKSRSPSISSKKSLPICECPMRDMLLDKRLEALPEEIRTDAKEAVRADEEKLTDVQKYLLEKSARSWQ